MDKEICDECGAELMGEVIRDDERMTQFCSVECKDWYEIGNPDLSYGTYVDE